MTAAAKDRVTIGAEPLSAFAGRIFGAAGCAPEEAARIAISLVASNLAGHDSHGVVHVARYVDGLAAGEVRAGQRLTMLREGRRSRSSSSITWESMAMSRTARSRTCSPSCW